MSLELTALWREAKSTLCNLCKISQWSNAKIQCHRPQTLQEFEEKTRKTFVRKWSKNSAGRENYKLGASDNVH